MFLKHSNARALLQKTKYIQKLPRWFHCGSMVENLCVRKKKSHICTGKFSKDQIVWNSKNLGKFWIYKLLGYMVVASTADKIFNGVLVTQMVKNPSAKQETPVWFSPWRSPGEGNGNPLQCSCLDNSIDRGDWQAKSMGRKESDTTEQLTLLLHFFFLCVSISATIKKKQVVCKMIIIIIISGGRTGKLINWAE